MESRNLGTHHLTAQLFWTDICPMPCFETQKIPQKACVCRDNLGAVSIWWYCLTTGLDAYFFINLGVGQPSNNMDLSETKIYLGSIIYVFFAMKKSWRTSIINIFILISRFIVFKEPCYVINHWCSSLEVALFISVHFDVTGIRNIFQRI